MSLTSSDLIDIRNIFKEEVEPVRGDIKALTNDVEEIYDRLTSLENVMNNLEGKMSSIERKVTPNKVFEKLSLEQKLMKLNSELLFAAKQAGISLPR